MIDFLYPFYTSRWRELMRELKQKGCFNEIAVKNLNTEFLYCYSLFMALGAVFVTVEKLSLLFFAGIALFFYGLLGMHYREEFKRMYLLNRSELRKAVVTSKVGWGSKNNSFFLFFDYEYPISGGVQESRCTFMRKEKNPENFYSKIFEGAEIQILVDQEDESLSVVPMRSRESLYKIDASLSFEPLIKEPL